MFVYSSGLETLLGRITAQRVISRMVGHRPPLLPPRLVPAGSSASMGESAASEALGKLVMVPQCQQQLYGVHVRPTTETEAYDFTQTEKKPFR